MATVEWQGLASSASAYALQLVMNAKTNQQQEKKLFKSNNQPASKVTTSRNNQQHM